MADGGCGHTLLPLHRPQEKEKMARHADVMKTCRILVNTPPPPRAASATSTTSKCVPP